MDWAQVLAIVLPVMFAVIIGVIYNNRRVDDLRSDMNQRFSEMNETMNQRFADMNHRFADMNQRFLEVNQRISELKSDIGEIRHLLVDFLRREVDIQKVADRDEL